MTHFNKLTPAEAERLALLAEECGEVVQAVTKILRHGYESCHPDGGPSNRELLEDELGDLHTAGTLLIEAKDVNEDCIEARAAKKRITVQQYLHHQKKVRG